MDIQQQKRVRSCSRKSVSKKVGTPRGSKQICIPMTRDPYKKIWDNAAKVRHLVDSLSKTMPEVFPRGIQDGYQLSGHLPESKKMPGIRLRQLRLRDGSVYTLRPSFVISYMTGTVEDIDRPLQLLTYGVPCWLVTECFGRNEMYWNRQLTRFGKNTIVGTTVRDPERLPVHLSADEHHADWCGEKGFVAFTAGAGCILGVALSPSADEEHLTEAYAKFAVEARNTNPDYSPETVNTDGWLATRKAFRNLFPTIITVLCFLHGFLKIRNRGRKCRDLHNRVWNVYRAATSAEFQEKMGTLRTWCEQASLPKAVMEMAAKLWNRSAEYEQ